MERTNSSLTRVVTTSSDHMSSESTAHVDTGEGGVQPINIESGALLGKRRKPNMPLFLSCGLNALLAIVVLAMLVRQSEDAAPTRTQAVPAPADVGGPDLSREACGGHGMWYDDADACECFDCWAGPTCSERLTGSACVVVADSGTPYLFESYWVAHPEARTTILPSYHIGYGSHLPRLERAIRRLHGLVGNADLDGREIVVGIGSTELISASLYALSPNATTPAMVWSRPPFYSGYRDPARFSTRHTSAGRAMMSAAAAAARTRRRRPPPRRSAPSSSSSPHPTTRTATRAAPACRVSTRTR
jgi:hypothetical protein